MKTRLIAQFGLYMCVMLVVGTAETFAATSSSKKQSAIQAGTSVRTKTNASGVYSQECYDAYYGCMDQFCILDNENGGSCACSDKNASLDSRLTKVKDKLIEAERIKSEEVERVQAGANADIIFTGKREYDSKTGEVLTEAAKEKRKSILSMWDDLSAEDDDEDIFAAISDKQGDELFSSADELCRSQMDMDSCSKDIILLKQMYSRQIVSDCKGFENSLEKQELAAKTEMDAANAAVRAALKESFDSANKYDRGECMVEYKKCMQKEDACGKDWENCVFTIASENMQNNQAKSTAKTKVQTIDTYDITASTMEILESKRYICERVLDSCVAVRDNVWQDFLREAAPTIRLAESKIESKKRQSCLSDISNCIQKACKDDIVGKGTETMDACLARPDMARSFCKVEIDPCERMEPQIWSYVKDKLAAMRVDACTTEVKECFTDETRCGTDFSNCIGMDFEYIHDMCPVDKLVVCKQANPNFKMDDLDSMLMGLYLNIDNSILDNCQNLIDEKMTEVCGSTTDCNKFASDDIIGTSSIQSQKVDSIYRVTGMISFGSIKMGNATGTVIDDGKSLKPGEIGVADYMENVRQKNANLPNAKGIMDSIEEELNNIAGTINRTIEMIEQDPKIQFCVYGRDLSQINGTAGAQTSARYPNLLNSVKMQIAIAALRQAQDNYNTKLTKEIAEATKNASADIAQYMCQKIAAAGNVSSLGALSVAQPLTPPYAIIYDVGSGLETEDLLSGGAGTSNLAGGTYSNKGYLGGASSSLGGVSKEVTSVFNREARTCHVCTTTATSSCKTTGSSSWFHNSRNTSCDTTSKGPDCEDIAM